MNAIDSCFSRLKTDGRTAFIAYITAGDPTLESTIRLVRELESAGTDIIELGVPFSDPVADGPVNQEAAQRALKNGVNVRQILEAVAQIRTESRIPIVLFTYLNTILAYGLGRFVPDARAAGVDGVLILDLPPEEAGEYKRLMNEHGLASIFLVSPITPPERIELIAKNTTGFIYYVAQMGVTGERETVSATVHTMIGNIRRHTNIPVVVGFGVSSPRHVKELSRYADGIVVGSAIVKRIGGEGNTPGFEKDIGAYVRTLTAPLKGGS